MSFVQDTSLGHDFVHNTQYSYSSRPTSRNESSLLSIDVVSLKKESLHVFYSRQGSSLLTYYIISTTQIQHPVLLPHHQLPTHSRLQCFRKIKSR